MVDHPSRSGPQQPDIPGSAPESAEDTGQRIARLGPGDPWRWLWSGAQDLMACWPIGLFYGLCFWLMALLLDTVFHSRPEYVMSVASGCLLVGPFLTMGLYDVSRCREQGRVPGLVASLTCWDRHLGSMGLLVLLLMVLELLWGRASLVVFAVFFDTGMPSTASLWEALVGSNNWTFLVAYGLVGSVFAGLVFGVGVVAIPMILDRDTDAISAAITSLHVVAANTWVMLCWGLMITVLVLVALLPWGLGLVLVGPWLGHASWHAYRGSVRWRTSPLSTPPSP